MRMFIISKNKYLSNDMKIFGTCSIPLTFNVIFIKFDIVLQPENDVICFKLINLHIVLHTAVRLVLSKISET